MEDTEDIEYLRSPSSKSGWHHVAFHKGNKNFQVYYKVNGRRTYIGAYDTAEEAARAYHNTTKDIVVDKRKNSQYLREPSPYKVSKRNLLSFAIESRERERRANSSNSEDVEGYLGTDA